MKRFWETASAVREAGAYGVRLDGRPMRLPGASALRLMSHGLAEAIAAEWNAAGGSKGGTFGAEDVPLTRLAVTAQERIAADPGPTIDALARYAETDLLCYRAASPEALKARQMALWQPWLDRAADRYGALLCAISGVMPQAQPSESLTRLRAAVAERSCEDLAGLGVIVPALGSLILGLAVAEGALQAADATDLAFLDHDFQAEKWGCDPEGTARRDAVAAEILCAARFIELSRASPEGGSNNVLF